MKAFLCVFVVWLGIHFGAAMMIRTMGRRRERVSAGWVWGGFAMSVVALLVWIGAFMAIVLRAEEGMTNGEVVMACLRWAGAPMVASIVLQIVGFTKTLRRPGG